MANDYTRDVKIDVQIGLDKPQMDKSVTFKDQFQYIWAHRANLDIPGHL